MISILKFTKGHNLLKRVDGVTVLVYAHRLIMLFNYTKFCQSISRVSQLQEHLKSLCDLGNGIQITKKIKSSCDLENLVNVTKM